MMLVDAADKLRHGMAGFMLVDICLIRMLAYLPACQGNTFKGRCYNTD